jgi:hypothetical protein
VLRSVWGELCPMRKQKGMLEQKPEEGGTRAGKYWIGVEDALLP